MKRMLNIAAIVIATAVTLPASAQGGPGQGRRMAIGPTNTPGWSLMTPEERTAHQQKMRSFTSYDDCNAYQAEHHQAMEARAKEQGKMLPAMRANVCDRMKARGLLK